MSSDVTALKIGETAAITFTFSEDPGTSFSAADIVVTGGTLGALSGSGTVRTATFTPAAGTDGGVAGISVVAGSYADAAGNAGAAGSTPALVFDTKAPTVAISSD
ncbi:Ig-like domain-containing protein, partial [Massilia varians]|uniref:Ig-like domain-containing protein n=1 Tax=Massilia varians TaxID=457921 RepID=UPI002553B1FD|nr:Ig-like domain-containing protein [Massilia varians]